MEKIAKFEKVSYEQFRRDMCDTFSDFQESEIERIYNNIVLPERLTGDSAGYVIRTPFGFDLGRVKSITIPTGIRCVIDKGWTLKVYPCTNLGFKYGFALINTVGIIDSDYAFADNEGHIKLKLTTDKTIVVEEGDVIAQGIFEQYGITIDDTAEKGLNEFNSIDVQIIN